MQTFEEPRIIGRASEMDQIRTFFSSHLESRRGGGLYVCGRSGTGKTEAVSQIFHGLKRCLDSSEENAQTNSSSNKRAKSTPRTHIVWMSGNTAQTSTTFFSSLAQKCGLKTLKNAEAILDVAFKSSDTLYILVTDEIDLLPQDTVRRLFAWASSASSSLVLVGIANVVNLGVNMFKGHIDPPAELAFAPYDAIQLRAIAAAKLGERAARFNPEALDMCARKASVKTGDVRACLSLCEEAFLSCGDRPKVTLVDVVRAAAATQSTNTKLVLSLPAQCKFALVACLHAAASSKIDLQTVKDAWLRLREVWKIPIEGEVADHLQMLCETRLLEEVSRPSSSSLTGAVKSKKKQPKTQEFKILPTKDEIYGGLIGEDDSDVIAGVKSQEENDPEVVKRRPIIMAFNDKRERVLVNMHVPLA